ncbi:lytic murein transglycosylase [Escherichia coli]|nr:hypothetical protein [Escherichia coli]
MRILLSNDDGVHAPGIQTLAKALREFADVQVVAPDRNRSGASNSLTLESSLRTFTFENGDIAVQMGTPTDCVYLGVNALMRPRPDIVVSGINAGPMGYGQFMPSSYKQYAVDFSGDGHINLWDPVDAIGSVANYFKAHGWVKGDQVAVMANGQAPGLPNGFKTRYSISQLAAAGLTPQQPLGNHQQASLLRLDVGTGYQYWYGLPNFYTITRYNHSTHYAMAVWQLGQAVALARVQ